MTTYKIFKEIANAEGAISGDTLGKIFDMSRAGINKHIKKLQAEGVQIKASGAGYKYEQKDMVNVYTLRLALEEKNLAYDVFCGVCESTNKWAKTIDSEKNFLCVAPYQTGGRGRFDRVFSSKEGGIYMSYCYHPKQLTLRDSMPTVLITGLAVANILIKYGLPAELKWPNDVFVNGKKINGILLESSLSAEYVEKFILGIGINVYNDVSEVGGTATSMKNELTQDYYIPQIIAEVVEEIDRLMGVFERDGFVKIKADYERISRTLGQEITVRGVRETIEGKAVGLSDEGFLIVEKDGEKRLIVAGDIL